MVADIEELEEMDASELFARTLNAKEVLTPMKGENFMFRLADGTRKMSGGGQRLRTSTLMRGHPLQDSSLHGGDARNDFWSFSGDFIYRHHVEPKVKLHMPREESLPIPLKYIDVTRNTQTSLDVMLEKHIEDYWNVDGDRELSDTWTAITRFTTLSEKPPDGYTWFGERLTRKQTTSRPDTLWPGMWKHTSDASKRKEKQKWAIEKPKLDNAR